ncbi:hypothetical protein GQ457_09G012640 [Hibiscus cannabinus]
MVNNTEDIKTLQDTVARHELILASLQKHAEEQKRWNENTSRTLQDLARQMNAISVYLGIDESCEVLAQQENADTLTYQMFDKMSTPTDRNIADQSIQDNKEHDSQDEEATIQGQIEVMALMLPTTKVQSFSKLLHLPHIYVDAAQRRSIGMFAKAYGYLFLSHTLQELGVVGVLGGSEMTTLKSSTMHVVESMLELKWYGAQYSNQGVIDHSICFDPGGRLFKIVNEHLGKEVEMARCEGHVTTFIVEPFMSYNEEFYLNIVSTRLGTNTSFSEYGRIESEESWDKIVVMLVPTNSSFTSEAYAPLVARLSLEIKGKIEEFIKVNFTLFQDLDFTFIEIEENVAYSVTFGQSGMKWERHLVNICALKQTTRSLGVQSFLKPQLGSYIKNVAAYRSSTNHPLKGLLLARLHNTEPSWQKEDSDFKDIKGIKGHDMLAPFTAGWQTTDFNPLVNERSEGSYVDDVHGKRYLDSLASLRCTTLGGNEPQLVEAAIAQLNKWPFYHSFWNPNDTQVAVAAFRKRHLKVHEESTLMYETGDKHSTTEGSPELEHNDELKFLDKAAIVSDAETKGGDFSSPWRLCTVTQVEELIILLRKFPVSTTIIVFAVVYAQMSTMLVEQGMMMDSKIGSFTSTPASLSTFDVIRVFFWVPIYDSIFIPTARKFTGKEWGFSDLQRTRIGLFISCLCMPAAAMGEKERLQLVKELDLVDKQVVAPISIHWQIPQYFLLGAAEVCTFIGKLEFFYNHSIGSNCLCEGVVKGEVLGSRPDAGRDQDLSTTCLNNR